MWGYNKSIKVHNSKKRFVILHTGTYKVLCARPWIYETSNEFVFGLQRLVLSVRNIENTELVIRIRSNEECEISSLEKLLPLSKNCHIKTDGNFNNDLAEADLLISFSSTTIEEALYAKIPVALFGGSDRYRHLPGSSTVPTADNRSAVYHLTKENISEMLEAIMAVHHNKPLTDDEVLGYVWPNFVPDMGDFVSNLINKEQNG